MGNVESQQPGSPRPSGQAQQLTYNGHRVSRRWEDDYVDISSEMEAISREEMEDEFKKIVDAMDLPVDKHQVVMSSPEEKKWQLVRDNTRRTRQQPPKEYLYKLRQVIEATSLDAAKKARKKATDPSTIQALQGLEISLRTNNISWVKEFLSDENCGLQQLVVYMNFRYQVELRESNLLSKPPLMKAKSEDSLTAASMSPKMQRAARHQGGKSDASDIHICVLCLKALMNNAHGFAAVMKDPAAISCMALSMFYGTNRTSITVIELLAAVCLVKGGHIKIIEAVDNFKKENGEQHRFEKLVQFFMDPKASAEFQGACMNFINVIVHSADDMNFRIHLQHEFTLLGLDEYIEGIKDSPNASPALVTQISAYQKNFFWVATLIEDSQTKTAALEQVQEMEKKFQEQQDRHQEAEFQSLKRIADLEKKIADLKKHGKDSSDDAPPPPPSSAPPPPPPGGPPPPPPPPPGGPGAPPPPPPPPGGPGAPPPPPPPFPGGPGAPPPPPPPGGARKIAQGLHPNKRKIETKYKLPLLNWVTIPATQISGTVFSHLDDESVFKQLDFTDFEETFKTKAQAGNQQGKEEKKPEPLPRKKPQRESLLDPNRSQNVAIAKKKLTLSSDEIKEAVLLMDLNSLPLEMVELINKITPNEDELKKFSDFSKEKKNPSSLAENDRFLYELNQIERLKLRLQVMMFMGNFEDDISLLAPQVDAVIAASKSVVSSDQLKKVLEVILAFGNYMNSSKRGGAFGFKLQSLDVLMDTRAPSDRTITLMHYVAKVIREKYPDAMNFLHELNYLKKAAAVSLDLLAADIRLLAKGMKDATGELVDNKSNELLKNFCLDAEPKVTKLQEDLETAKEAFGEVVQFFGCNAKTTQPNSVFPVLDRFLEGFRKADGENLAKIALRDAQLKQEQLAQEDENCVDVLPQIYDGAIDELITGMKNAVYRPANYRKNTLTRNTSASSAQEDLMRSLNKPKVNGPAKKNPYTNSRPWLK